MKNVTIVSPFYNEQESIKKFLYAVDEIGMKLLRKKWKLNILLVNDGSTDGSVEIVLDCFNKTNAKIELLNLALNSGHQNALWAGIEASKTNSYTIVMDSDLQDPPEIITSIINEFDSGFDVVMTQRTTRKDNFFKSFFSYIYYRLLKLIGSNAMLVDSGDFFGLSPEAKKRLILHKESVKYIRGLIQNLSNNLAIVAFDRKSRFAGKTKYPLSKMIKLAISGLTGFTIKPLIWSIYLGFIGIIIGSATCFYLLIQYTNNPAEYPPGYIFSNTVLISLALIIIIVLSMLSMYVSMIVIEIKNRPLYFIKDRLNNDRS